MSVQIITPDQALRMPGIPGVDYQLDRAPFTRYVWDGTQMVPSLSGAQAAALNAASPDGAAFALTEAIGSTKILATSTVKSQACELGGYVVINAGTGGTITIYDATSADTSKIVLPTTNLAVGRAEFNFKWRLLNGCHVVIGGTGSPDVNILVD